MAKKRQETYVQQPKLASLIRREKESMPAPDPTTPKASKVTSVMVLDTPSRETEGIAMGESLRQETVPRSIMARITGEDPEGK